MPRPFDETDLLRHRLVRDLQLRPDGSEIAIEIKAIDEAADDYCSNLYLAPAAGGDGLALTHDGSSAMPRWSPDGRRLAFLSGRGGAGPQLHLLSRGGGEAVALPQLPHGVIAFSWSPDGAQLVAVAPVDTEPPPADAALRERWRRRPRVVDWQRYKSDDAGFLLHRRLQLFLVEARPGGKVRQLTHEAADASAPSWHPDGRRLVYCQARPHPRESHLTDLVELGLDGSRRLLCDEVASAAGPAWSPDGRWIAFTGARAPGEARSRLWLHHVARRRLLQPGEGDGYEAGHDPLARTAPPQWSADARKLAFLHVRDGLTPVAVIEVPGGELLGLHAGEHQATCLHAGASRIAYAAGSLREATAVYTCDWACEDPQAVTRPNAPWWDERELPRVQRRRFRMSGGRQAVGWLLQPPQGSGPTPLLVDVRGSPGRHVSCEFAHHAGWYALCGRGWSVLALDPADAGGGAREDGPRPELDQLLAAARQLQRAGRVNGVAVISGTSWGGYVAAWALGQTRRFAAAVVAAPVANLESHAATSDRGDEAAPALAPADGEGSARRERLRQLSPVQHAHRAVTPTLILQGEDDQRCPLGQAEELFAALMRESRAPVQMVIYPGGRHDLAEGGRPSHRVDFQRRLVGWAEHWGRKPRRRGARDWRSRESSASLSPEMLRSNRRYRATYRSTGPPIDHAQRLDA